MSTKTENAIEIINDNIAKYMNKYAITKDNEESKELKKKIDFLEMLKKEVYLNKRSIVNDVLEKHKKGIL